MTTIEERKMTAVLEGLAKQALKYKSILAECKIPMTEAKIHKQCVHVEGNTGTIHNVYAYWDAGAYIGNSLRICSECNDLLREYEVNAINAAHVLAEQTAKDYKKAKDDALFDIARSLKLVIALLRKAPFGRD